jgi:tRNA pseudouridine38-40 synthase
LLVEYDGTEFSGWQRQPDCRTVQACLEEAFFSITGERLRLTAAGRTDAGVHAEGQVASLHTSSSIPATGLLRGLNTALPPDVAVLAVEDVAPRFDARRDARGKVYRYLIWNHMNRSPRRRKDVWHVRQPLDVHAMKAASAAFIGEHDFRAFRAANCERLSTVRVIRSFAVWREGALITCELEGTAFLKNMVRILAGTLVAAGEGRLDALAIERILKSGHRAEAGQTAPPHGLTLVRVLY